MAAKPQTPFPRVSSVGMTGMRFTMGRAPGGRVGGDGVKGIKISGGRGRRQQKTKRNGLRETISPEAAPPLYGTPGGGVSRAISLFVLRRRGGRGRHKRREGRAMPGPLTGGFTFSTAGAGAAA